VTQICPVCGRLSPFGQTHPRCYSRFSLTGLISLFDYEGIIRKAIHQLKYRQVTDLLDEFWEIVAQELAGRAEELSSFHQFLKEKPAVIPIPLFWYKENLRGFNQSSLIGKRLAERYNLDFLNNFLVRRKMTSTQTKLNPKERQKNVKDAFVINSHSSLPTTNFLLIDDVWTTGATLKAAGNVLKRVGAKKVWGLTLAR
jgi:ComF family protein